MAVGRRWGVPAAVLWSVSVVGQATTDAPTWAPRTSAPTSLAPSASPLTSTPTRAPWSAAAAEQNAISTLTSASTAAAAAESATAAREGMSRAVDSVTLTLSPGQSVEVQTDAHYVSADRQALSTAQGSPNYGITAGVTGGQKSEVRMQSSALSAVTDVLAAAGASRRGAALQAASVAASMTVWQSAASFPGSTQHELRGSPTATITAAVPGEAELPGDRVEQVSRLFAPGGVVQFGVTASQGISAAQTPLLQLGSAVHMKTPMDTSLAAADRLCSEEFRRVERELLRTQTIDRTDCRVDFQLRVFVPRHIGDSRRVVLPRQADGGLGLRFEGRTEGGQNWVRVAEAVGQAAAEVPLGSVVVAVGSRTVSTSSEADFAVSALAGSDVPLTIDPPMWEWVLANETALDRNAGTISGESHFVASFAGFASVSFPVVTAADLSLLERLEREAAIIGPVAGLYVLYVVLLVVSYYMDVKQDSVVDTKSADADPFSSPAIHLKLDSGVAPADVIEAFAEAAGVSASRVEMISLTEESTSAALRILPTRAVRVLWEKERKAQAGARSMRGSYAQESQWTDLGAKSKSSVSQFPDLATALAAAPTAHDAARAAVAALQGSRVAGAKVLQVRPERSLEHEEEAAANRRETEARMQARWADTSVVTQLRAAAKQMLADIAASHLWLSYFFRAQNALLSRVRRLTVLITHMLTVLAVAAIFFEHDSEAGDGTGVVLTGLYVAIASAPASLLSGALYRRVRREPGRLHQHRTAIVTDATSDTAELLRTASRSGLTRSLSRRRSGLGTQPRVRDRRLSTGLSAAIQHGASLQLSPRGTSYVGVYALAPPLSRFQPPDAHQYSDDGQDGQSEQEARMGRAPGRRRRSEAATPASQARSAHTAHGDDLPTQAHPVQLQARLHRSNTSQSLVYSETSRRGSGTDFGRRSSGAELLSGNMRQQSSGSMSRVTEPGESRRPSFSSKRGGVSPSRSEEPLLRRGSANGIRPEGESPARHHSGASSPVPLVRLVGKGDSPASKPESPGHLRTWWGPWQEWGKAPGDSPKARSGASSPGPYTDVSVVKRPGEQSLGLRWHDHTRLVAVDPGSAAARCGLGQFIGKRLSHINGVPVTRLRQIKEKVMACQRSALVLRFLDEAALGSPFAGAAASSAASSSPFQQADFGALVRRRSTARALAEASLAFAGGAEGRLRSLVLRVHYVTWMRWLLERKERGQPLRLVERACGQAQCVRVDGRLRVAAVAAEFMRRAAVKRTLPSYIPDRVRVTHTIRDSQGKRVPLAVPAHMTVREVAEFGHRVGDWYSLRIGDDEGSAADDASMYDVDIDADQDAYKADDTGAVVALAEPPPPSFRQRAVGRLVSRMSLLCSFFAVYALLAWAYDMHVAAAASVAACAAALLLLIPEAALAVAAATWALCGSPFLWIAVSRDTDIGIYLCCCWVLVGAALAARQWRPALVSACMFVFWLFTSLFLTVSVLEQRLGMCFFLPTATVVLYGFCHYMVFTACRLPYVAVVLFCVCYFVVFVVLVGVVPWGGGDEPSAGKAAWMGAALTGFGLLAAAVNAKLDGRTMLPDRLDGLEWMAAVNIGTVLWHALCIALVVVLTLNVAQSGSVSQYWTAVGIAWGFDALGLDPLRVVVLSQTGPLVAALRRRTPVVKLLLLLRDRSGFDDACWSLTHTRSADSPP
eukprot:TRINITY_DN12516_c0_g1_i1.p1 TRINITY_DN12516_c0_g1~~TRINITY_DN12516_c0_g1_i1.p1  ORF type:complete len:1684 (+),score=487.10 TRINITY_DN12516_c0_g1_i1:91-5142(+)